MQSSRVKGISCILDTDIAIDFLRHLGHLFGTLFLYHGPQGVLARTWATGNMVLWVVILLGLYLVAYYY